MELKKIKTSLLLSKNNQFVIKLIDFATEFLSGISIEIYKKSLPNNGLQEVSSWFGFDLNKFLNKLIL